MKKVDLIIGGMQKGGTTALARYLEAHPAIESHPHMEMTYFYDMKEYEQGWTAALKKYFFDCRLQEGQQLLLAKHATLIRSKEALKRLVEHNPAIKLLVILRNPVDRAWSSYLMEVSNGEPEDTFYKAAHQVTHNRQIDTTDWRQNVYFGLGLYINFLTYVYEVVPEAQVKIIFLEEMQQQPQQVIAELLAWLGLPDEGFDYTRTKEKINAYAAPNNHLFSGVIKKVLKNDNLVKGGIKKILHPKLQYILGEKLRSLNKRPAQAPNLDPDVREKLQAFYAPYNQRLATLLNKELTFWHN